jgi:5'-nucleotidase
MKQKPLILVTNDDGITAKGISSLVEIASEFGEVVVVAPNTPQSAKGHGITVHDPLRIYRSPMFEGLQSFECSGTPVDCVKLAKHVVLKDRQIDLCVSGINHGSNASVNIIYSGTMAAATEAAMQGINAIGFSLCDFSATADFSAAKVIVRQVIAKALAEGMATNHLWNVNIPKVPLADIKGIKICRQAKGRWTEDFLENKDPMGKVYYWLSGKYEYLDKGEDTDEWALANDYVSLVPCIYDLTDVAAVEKMERFRMVDIR